MTLDEIIKLQLKRVNAFQGLVIDVDIWQDAHEYHRNQQKLHLLAFHSTGIVQGLRVVGNNPPDLSVTIEPGVAVDPEGNVIIVPQAQRYQIQTRQKGTIYLIIQFREIPTEPFQPPEGGQATRVLEAYRVQERDKLPKEVYLELARIDFDPSEEVISDAKKASQPSKNEINLTSRQEVKAVAPATAVAPAAPAVPEKASAPPAEVIRPKQGSVLLGYAVLGEANNNLHSDGLKNLARLVSRQSDFAVDVVESISLDKDISQYTMLYLVGNSGFELGEEERTALSDFLHSGGVIFGEGCSEGQEEVKGTKEFGLAFNQLAVQLKCKLEIVQPGHSLLSTAHVFSAVPGGAEPNGMLLEGEHMVYSGSDYGCAWQGGHKDNPLSREIIRSSFEIGTNIITYAHMIKSEGASP